MLVVKIGALASLLPVVQEHGSQKMPISDVMEIESLDKSIFQKIGTENGIHADWIDEVFQKFLDFNLKRNSSQDGQIEIL